MKFNYVIIALFFISFNFVMSTEKVQGSGAVQPNSNNSSLWGNIKRGNLSLWGDIKRGFSFLTSWSPYTIATKKAASSRYVQQSAAEVLKKLSRPQAILYQFNNIIYDKLYNNDLKRAVNKLNDSLTNLSKDINSLDGSGTQLTDAMNEKIKGLKELAEGIQKSIEEYDKNFEKKENMS